MFAWDFFLTSYSSPLLPFCVPETDSADVDIKECEGGYHFYSLAFISVYAHFALVGPAILGGVRSS